MPTLFRHPQAEREINLDGHGVGYALKRARRRTIGFIVGLDGLVVKAPKWVAQRDIDAALATKSAWILRKLGEQRERAERLQAAKVDWRDGTTIPFLGETVIVVLDPRTTGTVLNADADALPGVARLMDQAPCIARRCSPFGRPGGLTLRVGLPQAATPAQIRDAVQSWLQRQARRVFEDCCRRFSAQLGVRIKRMSLSSAQTRWGSASADGSIRLNWRLVHFTLPTIDYVVVHELAHLREMNHGPRFWDVVRAVLPEYEAARGMLKDGVLPVFD